MTEPTTKAEPIVCNRCGHPKPEHIDHLWACCGDGPGYRDIIKPETVDCLRRQLAEANAKLEAQNSHGRECPDGKHFADCLDCLRSLYFPVAEKLEAAERELLQTRAALSELRFAVSNTSPCPLCKGTNTVLAGGRYMLCPACRDQRQPVSSGTEEQSDPVSAQELCDVSNDRYRWRQRAERLESLLGLAEIPEECPEYAPNGYGAELQRVVAILLAGDLDTEETASGAVAALVKRASEARCARCEAVDGVLVCGPCAGTAVDREQLSILDSHVKELIELLKYDGRENLVADVALTGESHERYAERTARRAAEPEATAAVDDDHDIQVGGPGLPFEEVVRRYGPLSPAVARAAEALAAQDPMLRCPTFGELTRALGALAFDESPVGTFAYELAAELERIAKGGGKL